MKLFLVMSDTLGGLWVGQDWDFWHANDNTSR